MGVLVVGQDDAQAAPGAFPCRACPDAAAAPRDNDDAHGFTPSDEESTIGGRARAHMPVRARCLPIPAFWLAPQRALGSYRSMASELQELRRLASSAQNRQTDTGIPRVAMVQGRLPEHALAAVY